MHSANRRQRRKCSLCSCQLYIPLLFVVCAITVVSTVVITNAVFKELTSEVLDYHSADDIPRHLLTRGPGGGYMLQARRGSGGPPLQLKHLRSFCAKYAPGLRDAWWGSDNFTVLPTTNQKTKTRLPPYPFVPKPVCFRGELLYFDGNDLDRRRSLSGASVRVYPTWRKLTDTVLMAMQNQASIHSVKFVPAIGMVPLNRFSLGQLYHVMNDMVKELMVVMTEVENATSAWSYSEFGKAPTQLFVLPRMELLWTRAHLQNAVPQTTRFLSAFSHPTVPPRYFFNEVPVLNKDVVYCTCQAIFATEVPPDESFEQKTVAFRLAADLMLRYMNETPYESAEDVAADWRNKGGVPLPILRRFKYVPHLARRFWEKESQIMERHGGNKPWGTPSSPPVYRPRLLLINRRRREIHDYETMSAIAERVGFNVQTVYLETMPLEEQYHIGRHADVIIGIHGMGLTHVLWMDGRHRPHCRALLELMPYGCPRILIHFYKLFADTVGIHYEYIEAADMYLRNASGHGIMQNMWAERNLQETKRHMLSCKFEYTSLGFAEQVAVYDIFVMEQRLKAAYNRLQKCGVV